MLLVKNLAYNKDTGKCTHHEWKHMKCSPNMPGTSCRTHAALPLAAPRFTGAAGASVEAAASKLSRGAGISFGPGGRPLPPPSGTAVQTEVFPQR